MNIKKAIFAGLMAASMAAAAGKSDISTPRPDTLIIIDAEHRPDFSGHMKCITLFDYMVKTERPRIFEINEDPEDLQNGDILSVTISGGRVTDYIYTGRMF